MTASTAWLGLVCSLTTCLLGCAAPTQRARDGDPVRQEQARVSCPASDQDPAPETALLRIDANGLSLESVLVDTDAGTIRFRFFPQEAPCTVARFRQLVRSGFYDGLRFHRVIPGFLVQGGDPSGNGTGGSGRKLKAEFNGRHHVEGTVAMARAQDPDSADSQFYFCLGTYPHLDRSYTIFGQVVEGMDVAKKLRIGDVIRTMRLVQ